MADEFELAHQAAVRASWGAWFETMGRIYDKAGNLITPQLNHLQEQLDRLVVFCRENDLPVRAILLKPRQKGSSTFSCAGLYHELCLRRSYGVIAGSGHYQCDNLYGKIETYAENDVFEWGTDAKLKAKKGEWSHGSILDKLTANNPSAGRSGTYQHCIITELAYWASEGVSNASKVLSGLLKTVPKKPGTTIIIESTPNGASGEYYDRYQDAVSFEEFVRLHNEGRSVEGKYVRIFSPWFAFEDSRTELSKVDRDELAASIEAGDRRDRYGEEREIMDRFDLELEQMAWRRWAIDNECERDYEQFEQDYPSTEEDAFLHSGRLRFNPAGLRWLRERAKQKEKDMVYCDIDMQDESRASSLTVMRPVHPREARFIVWERPKEGHKYIMPVDLMTGESQVSGKNPDCHSTFVLRAGYWGPHGWVKPCTAARIIWPCRWDIDVLEMAIWKLYCYYGQPMVVPEVNMDRGLIELMKLRGISIYLRKTFNQRKQKEQNALGWMTNVRTREMAVDSLARMIRGYNEEGDGIDIYCEHAISELSHFVVKKNGKSEADAGWHDDDVLSLAIGSITMPSATVCRYTRSVVDLPRDIRELDRRTQSAERRNLTLA